MPQNIAFFELEKWEEKYLTAKLGKTKNLSLSFFNHALDNTTAQKIKKNDILAVFIYSRLTKQILDKLVNLKFLATMSTGYDHIDLAVCRERNIKVSNVPFYGENTVAEHTMALLLALSRKLFDSLKKTKAYDFSLDGLRGFDLKNKTLGLIGLGHIGAHVAKMAKGFDLNVLASDPRQDIKLAQKLGIKYVPFNYLLAHADIISLHAPYNKKTHHLINKKNINLIKKGAYLINTSRGGLIETQALITALNKKILAGVALDVLEEECVIKEEKELLSGEFQKKCDLKTIIRDHYLIRDPRVLVTPHNAFNSTEALHRILDTTIENITAFLMNKPINLVG